MEQLKIKLLDLLQQDCRIPTDTLSVMLNESKENVEKAIKEMENDKVILCYRPLINWEHTEMDRVEAMIEVSVTPQRDMGFDKIAGRIYRFDEVKSVFLMSGGYDLLVLVEAGTLKELAFFVSEKLSSLESVTGTKTSFVLKRYKQEGVVFEGDNSEKRLMVSL